MQKKKILFMLALLCAVVQGTWAQDEWATVYKQTQTTATNWTALDAGSTTGKTLGSAGNTTFYYVTSNLSFTNSTVGGSGLTILGTVYLYVPEGMTLTCTGADASAPTGGGAGIELATGNSLYLIGGGTLNATGGNAANGGKGGKGDDAYNGYPEDNLRSGTGGTGGTGGGGAGAGIGTRGGNGGSGGAGGAGHERTGDGWDTANGNNGSAGNAGTTAGAIGSLYVFQSWAPTVNADGGNAGSSGGNGGNAGWSALWDGHLNWPAPGGGGGGAGGFGGAASNIGTGGPGGGGGGGGAGGSLDWKNTGYYYACAPGGKGGQNADGSYASEGQKAEVSPTAFDNSMCGSNGSWSSDDCSYGSGRSTTDGTGGTGAARGSASTSGSASTVTVDWSTQEDDWNLICLLTGSTRADWVHLADGSTKGKTLGAAGTTTYYYTAADRTFSNSNAGGSGLTILGTVYLYIPSGKTITCTGANATAPTGGGAGIELAAGNTLYIIGSGTLNATGGNAANGGNGGAGGDADFKENYWVQSGAGGKGGDGGGGAGAGIGTHGGNGGAGGAGGARVSEYLIKKIRLSGNIGNNGDNGGTAADMGTLYIYQIPALTTEIHGGSGGTSRGNGGAGGRHALFASHPDGHPWLGTVGGGAGGAGGGFGGAASDIGTGGPGGGGGGGGSSGSVQNHNNNTYFLLVGAFGGAPGANADGTFAGAGEETLMVDVNNLAQTNHINLSELVKGDWGQDGAGNKYGDNRAAGGAGGTAGAASVSGSANAVTVGWPTQGKGIEDAPFIVSSTDDWNEFASYVNSGYAFSGNFVKLGDDISVSTMAGTSDANSFQGTFDGDGNTLTFTKGTSQEPFGEDYSAPFRHVKNAVIKNLHVDGSIYTSVQKAAGFVGESHGALIITNCRSSINITGSKSGDGTFGGFVATLSGSSNAITIEGCVFDGSFATTANTGNCGGFIGWPVYNKPTIKNSLMKPSSVAANMLNNTFTRVYSTNEPTITNCYFVETANLPTNQGTQAYAVNTAPANLGDLVQNYGMVAAYQNGILYDSKYYVAPATISLANAANNSTTISNANNYVANVTLADRTLSKSGEWNTLCLPFEVSAAQMAESTHPLYGAIIKELNTSTSNLNGEGLLTLSFNTVTSIEAGKPYIVKWENASGTVSDPVFSGVTISSTTPTAVEFSIANSNDKCQFVGQYSPFSIVESGATGDDQGNLNEIIMLGANSMLGYSNNARELKTFRCHFYVPANGGLGARAFVMNLGDDEATGIISIENGKLKIENEADAWYSLDGRRLDGKPKAKGLYIRNGKKVIIK